MTTPLLTIVIPTYDRPERLVENLNRIAPQLDGRCRLVIIDNASGVPVGPLIKGRASAWSRLAVRTYEPGVYIAADLTENANTVSLDIFTNAVNIGAPANILRAFEVCHSDWLWILGDDDPVDPTAITTIFEHIAAFPESLFICFSLKPGQRQCSKVVKGCDDLIANIHSFAATLLISVGVYQARFFHPFIKIGYRYIYGGCPHFALLLSTVSTEGSCCLSSATLVNQTPASRDQRWSFMDLALGVNTLLELPLQEHTIKNLARLTPRSLPAPESLMLRLLIMAKTASPFQIGHLYDALYERIYKPGGSNGDRLKWRLYYPLLKYPQLSVRAVSCIANWFGRKVDDSFLEDRLSRM